LLELGEMEFEGFGLGVEVDFILADLDEVVVFGKELLLHVLECGLKEEVLGVLFFSLVM
jgi:hypothetical protein